MRVKLLVVCFLTVVAVMGLAQDQQATSERPTYKTGWGAMIKLGMELQRALKPQYRSAVNPRPINIETDVTPFVRLEEMTNPDTGEKTACVFVSAGFIDLVNNVAHAKAIDKVEKGYFQRYVLSLSEESGDKELKPLPNLENRKYWSMDMMNEQLSNFNQIVGEVVGIKLAHFYLGHYKKYAAQLKTPQGEPVSINTFLAPNEWDQAVKCGVHNALDCGLGVEGVKALYECIEKMPRRPAWTLHFVPPNADIKRLRKVMEKMEKDYFAGVESK